ncbi:hypothetical protein SS50377_26266 [Spironucleus salmonicida]|uniref:Transmembrane protein n=1 Tax=Spironucleus salmonicida TaxID=348837 RepID=V6LJ40_9EUKA|nr:hypothetical protein SS50377_26266 [Spironucleus salmonicida]|eukprot:EST44363.1 Hypothetical protein SS50377_15794 [Spironucleus salmonicida]
MEISIYREDYQKIKFYIDLYCKMLLVLFEVTQCFHSNSTLIATMQKSQYIIQISNMVPAPIKCVAFNNTLSKAKLNYIDAGSTKSIETEFQYFSEGSLTIYFDKIPAGVFSIMTKLTIISYTMLLQEQLEVPGQFSLITNTLVNTSNCWSDLSLNYSRSGKTSYLNLSGTPNDCLITDPTVSLQYQVGSQWKQIAIAPLDPAPADYEGYKLPFVHLSTKFYRLNFSDSTAEIQKQIDTFFTEFTADRQMQIRLSMHFTQPGSSLEQQIFSYIRNISSQSMECQTAIDGFGSITSQTLQIVGNLSSLNTCQKGASVVNSSAIFTSKQYIDQADFETIVNTGGILFMFKNTNESILTDSTATTILVFVTLIAADGSIIREEGKYYPAVLSCFYKFMTLVSYSDTCVVFFPVQSERCIQLYSKNIITKIQQVLQVDSSYASRQTYQSYEYHLQFESVIYYKTCLNRKNETDSSIYLFYHGDYYNRQNAFIKNLKISFRPLMLINNIYDSQYSYFCEIDSFNALKLTLCLVFGSVLIIVVIVTIIIAVKANQ